MLKYMKQLLYNQMLNFLSYNHIRNIEVCCLFTEFIDYNGGSKDNILKIVGAISLYLLSIHFTYEIVKTVNKYKKYSLIDWIKFVITLLSFILIISILLFIYNNKNEIMVNTLVSSLINAMAVMWVGNKAYRQNEKRNEFDKNAYNMQVNKNALKFLSKYLFGLDSTNFKEKESLKAWDKDGDDFESRYSVLFLEGSLRQNIIRVIEEYDKGWFPTACITSHDAEALNGKLNIWKDLFTLNYDERREVLRILKEDLPKKSINKLNFQ